VLEELASLYLRRASDEQQVYAVAQTRSELLSPVQVGQPPAASPLGKALSSLTSPIQSAVASSLGTQTSDAYSKVIQFESDAVGTYKQLAKLSPKDAPTQLRLAQVAQGAGDTTTAIAAYKRFLQLAPDDPLAPTAKKTLKELEAQQKASSATATPTTKRK
jgi:tetratricopeptide (TPR) repeat protein